MANLFVAFSVLFACLCGGLITILFVEIIAALALPTRALAAALGKNCGRVAAIIPAHDEGVRIAPTIEDIKLQLREGDQLIVVADNCTDDTAAQARNSGAAVVERHDLTKIGKGYALQFGIEQLTTDPPAVVIFVDADCRVSKGSIDQLREVCAATHRPVQALDLMTATNESPINLRVAEFAWRVKNWIRPLGLQKLNLPCQLMGTGMAFPWDVIRSVNLATGSIVEDLKLGLDLATIGHSPVFCPAAKVTSHFPLSIEGATSQRKRWEAGHLHMIFARVPILMFKAIRRANFHLFVLTLDLAIPPLSVLAGLGVLTFFVSTLVALFGLSLIPLFVSALSLVSMIIAIFLVWVKYGRDLLPPRSVLSVAQYIFAKLPIYRQFLFGGGTSRWTRADRGKDD